MSPYSLYISWKVLILFFLDPDNQAVGWRNVLFSGSSAWAQCDYNLCINTWVRIHMICQDSLLPLHTRYEGNGEEDEEHSQGYPHQPYTPPCTMYSMFYLYHVTITMCSLKHVCCLSNKVVLHGRSHVA